MPKPQAKTGKRGTCMQCSKGPRRLSDGICQHECLGKRAQASDEERSGIKSKQCHACKQLEGTGPVLNWVVCANPKCGTCYHSVCTKLGEISKKALSVVYWICPDCATSFKPIWVNNDSDASLSATTTTSSNGQSAPMITLDQVSNVMENLVKQIVPKLVEDALTRNSVDRSNNLESDIVDNGYIKVMQESSERQKRRCNVIIRGLEESQSDDAEEWKLHDERLFGVLADRVGLQDKPVKIMCLGRINRESNPQQYNRPMRMLFCREDPVIHLISARSVNLDGQVYWFGRDLTKHERDLEYNNNNNNKKRGLL